MTFLICFIGNAINTSSMPSEMDHSNACNKINLCSPCIFWFNSRWGGALFVGISVILLLKGAFWKERRLKRRIMIHYADWDLYICFSHQDSEEKEFSSFVVQALEPAVCLVSLTACAYLLVEQLKYIILNALFKGTWTFIHSIQALSGLSLRAVICNTCYGWICFTGPWCYRWSQLLLVQFTHKTTYNFVTGV